MQPVAITKNRKTLSLALSGCAGKAFAYIGLLEVFEEHGIPVDAIAACSSAAVVAAVYACGNLGAFKEWAFSLRGGDLLSFFSDASFQGGVFSFEKFEESFGRFITVEHIEDLPVRTVIVASDLVTGSAVVFSMGDLMRAIRASCSVPGLFEPVVWGRQVLIDGGLFSIVPVEAARLLGCDRIVAVRVRSAAPNIFSSQVLYAKNGYNRALREPMRIFGRAVSRVSRSVFGIGEPEPDVVTIDVASTPSIAQILGKSMDYAIEERRKVEQYRCDLMVEIDGSGYGRADTDNSEKIYMAGRRAAEAVLPQIKEMLS
jgi:predicted acylesterase/phospholipase RssA